MKNISRDSSDEELEFFKKIEAYTSGTLNQAEVEKLWEVMILHPEWVAQFETLLNFKSLVNEQQK